MNVEDIENSIDVAVNLLKAMSNERRLKILCALYRGEKCVGDLEDIVGLSQSAISQHLARLRKDGVVNTRRNAQTIYYSIDGRAVHALLRCLYDIYSPDGELTYYEDFGHVLDDMCPTDLQAKKARQ